MHPIICTIGPFTIYSYGLMLVLAFSVSFYLIQDEARRQKQNSGYLFNLLFFSFICGILGARIFYIFANIQFYLNHPAEMIMLQHGGLSWFGGLLFGGASAAMYLKKKKLPILKVLDLIAPFLALAHAIGRIGCLLNGCCYGRESLCGIYFPAHDAVLIPTQLYSSLILIFIYIVLRLLQDRPRPRGEIFFTYLFLYSLKRFFIEFWRADSTRGFLGLTLFQAISIAVFIISIAALIRIKRFKS